MSRFIGVALGVVLALLISGVALAEGGFDSYMRDVLIGFDSRNWDDRDLDNASTTVRLENCRDVIANGANDWATIRLWRHQGIFPPQPVGNDKQLFCWVGATGNWGAQVGSEWFHFQVRDFSGPDENWNNLDANPVKVRY